MKEWQLGKECIPAGKRDLLSVTDLTPGEFHSILDCAIAMKKEHKETGKNAHVLEDKTLITIYEKPSLRTHASFDIGMTQLGGSALYLGPEHIGLGKREPVEHAAHVLSSMGDFIMARVFDHATIVELAANSSILVINGLSDLEHPCQIVADMMTILERKERLKGLTLAYVGDGENNVTHSLALACGLLGIHIRVATPNGYAMKSRIAAKARSLAAMSGGSIVETHDPRQAVTGADIVYTDTWISMGDEEQKAHRLEIFPPFRVNEELMKLAQPDAIFMHDMPAYLGNEVTQEVFDGPQSAVYQQAENRLHAQKALLVFLAKGGE